MALDTTARKTLREVVGRSIVVCYKEDVGQLLDALDAEGLAPIEQRGSYTSDELKLSGNTRAFINHRAAWRIAAAETGYTIICEADFVPCAGMGGLPVFWPLERRLAWGYLYQGSPRLLSIIGENRYLRGHCAPFVGYVINADMAKLLLEYFDAEIAEHGHQYYFSFDAHMQWWVMGHGAEAYIPLHHYGEHGGMPNPEHARIGQLRLSGAHHADNLAGPLAFRPQYAEGSYLKFLQVRAISRALGLLRLLSGRWIIDTNVYPRDWRQTLAMYAVGLRRLM